MRPSSIRIWTRTLEASPSFRTRDPGTTPWKPGGDAAAEALRERGRRPSASAEGRGPAAPPAQGAASEASPRQRPLGQGKREGGPRRGRRTCQQPTTANFATATRALRWQATRETLAPCPERGRVPCGMIEPELRGGVRPGGIIGRTGEGGTVRFLRFRGREPVTPRGWLRTEKKGGKQVQGARSEKQELDKEK